MWALILNKWNEPKLIYHLRIVNVIKMKIQYVRYAVSPAGNHQENSLMN